MQDHFVGFPDHQALVIGIGAVCDITPGSIPFGGSNNCLTQDNANLFWDDANNRLGLGTNTPNSTLQVNGSLAFQYTSTAVSITTSGDTIIGVTDTSVARTITLASADAVVGRIITIKDESGAAGTNNITIATEGSETIDGAATNAIIANFGAGRYYSNGSNWFGI